LRWVGTPPAHNDDFGSPCSQLITVRTTATFARRRADHIEGTSTKGIDVKKRDPRIHFNLIETTEGWIEISFRPKPELLPRSDLIAKYGLPLWPRRRIKIEPPLDAMEQVALLNEIIIRNRFVLRFGMHVSQALRQLLCDGSAGSFKGESVLVPRRSRGRPRETREALKDERQKMIDRMIKLGLKLKRKDPKAKVTQPWMASQLHYSDDRTLRNRLSVLGINWRLDVLAEIEIRIGN
jgi:hypothetical protein